MVEEAPRRVNFVSGMVLGAADLAAEQGYHREMRYLHNRLHGYGTVSGLEVSVTRGRVRVDPGLAIDPWGREIVLAEPSTVRLEQPRGTGWARDLLIAWHEQCDGQVPGPDGPVFTRVVEQPELFLADPGEGGPEALVLARLTRTSRGGVAVDATVRRPLGSADPGAGTGRYARCDSVSPSDAASMTNR